MSKRQKRQSKRQDRVTNLGYDNNNLPPRPSPRAVKEPLTAKTEAQRRYISSIGSNKITFGIGPAGVGKTYCAARVASQLILNKDIKKVYLTRPAVESGRPIGFLKGDLEEKMAPYIASYLRGFEDGMGRGHFDYMMKSEQIEIVPLNFMQGRSFDEPCMVLFDEAENATIAEMKMFLTRMGDGARLVIDGDPDQQMTNDKSGLIDGYQKIRYLNQVGAVEFDRDDIVRHGLVREILDAYDEQQDSDEDHQLELPGFITRKSE